MPPDHPTDRPEAVLRQPPGLGWRAIVLLVACFLLVKLPFLIWSPYTYDEEEVKPGAVAHILLTDSRLPLSEYVLGGYEGGVLVVALATIPFEIVFGHTILAYKILALCVAAGILALAALLAGRIAGRAAGLVAGLLIVFSPPYLTQFQFILWGNYVESALLTLAAFVLLHRMLFLDKTSLLGAAALGLICGLGVFIHYGFAVTPIAVVVMWYLVDHRLVTRRLFRVFVAGAIIGFSPWIVYNMAHGFAGLGRVSDGMAQQTLTDRASDFLSRLGHLFSVDYPMAWHFKDVLGVPAKILGYAYWLALLAGLLGLLVAIRHSILPALRALLPSSRFDLPREPKTAALIFPVFLIGYWTVYCATDYGLLRAYWGNMDPETHVHIFLTFYPLLICLALAIGFAARTRAKLAWLALFPALLGMAGSWALLDFDHSNRDYLKQNFAIYVDAVYSEIGYTYAARDADWGWIPPLLSDQSAISFYYGLGSGFGERHFDAPTEATALCAPIDTEAGRAVCVFGVGAGAFQNYDAAPEARRRGLESLPDTERVWFLGGAADILLMEGFSEHPLIKRAREVYFAEEFGRELPELVRDYMRSRLSAHRILSTKD